MDQERRGLVDDLRRGAVIGVAATLAMSAVMLLADRLGLMAKHPPERIVERGSQATGTPTNEDQQNALASVAHLGFGAAGGVGFGMLAHLTRPPIPGLLAVPWALAIWAGSYFGWIPALGILPPPTRDAPGRASTMLVAHLVYGLSLGVLWRGATSR
ncbi:MAG TPA: DUF6789 family protein [Candidatus Limnocylindria bacterium]|jgi:hypothetical protein|nr:DUF6789 family protein [Candidatus Limnocylindria bacterium]